MLLFALNASQKGWNVVIGGKRFILPNLHQFPEGVVLLKSIVPGELELQEKILSYGHKITSIDAEGLLPSNGKSGVELRYSEETIKKSHQLFFWGREQFNQVKEYFPLIEENSFITGSPIFDYWRLLKRNFEKTVEKTKQKTILIATSFPYPNHFIDRKMSYDSVRAASGKNATDEHLNEIFLDGKLQDLVYPLFKNLVKEVIKNYPQCKIILRPHPSENQEVWKNMAKGYENVEMSLSGEISPLLLESDVLIHFNSTTSIEAFYFGKSIITLIPEDLPQELLSRLNPHAKQASSVAHDTKQALEFLENALQGKINPSSFDLENIIIDSSKENISQSSLNILNQLDSLKIQPPSRPFPNWFKLNFSIDIILNKLKLRCLWILGWIDDFTFLFKGKYKPNKNYYAYGKTKQGRLPKEEVKQRTHFIAQSLSLDINSIQIKKFKDGLFLINQKDV